MAIKNKVQLITYPDSLGGDLRGLKRAVDEWFPEAAAGGIHILPPFPSSADRGFAPTTYEEIDGRFGNWDDIRSLAESYDVMVDLMVNHISRRSRYFQDFEARGRRSAYADMFITLDKVWPGGIVPSEDVRKIFLRKPDNPFSDIAIKEGGAERVWTSFGTKDWSEQIDLDVRSETTRRFIVDTLTRFSHARIKGVRLDAIGYVTKKAGTSCFMVEPEISEFMDWLVSVASPLGLDLLPEIHAERAVQRSITDRGYLAYDFVLPMLVLTAMLRRSSARLRPYLRTCPHNQFTMLDCHDGIPVQPDLDGVLPVEESAEVVRRCLERGANLNRILSGSHVAHEGFDAHQINITFYSTLGDDDLYLAARAIQFFSPGIPQVYYVGLLAGRNDEDAVRATGEGRAINRHDYGHDEIGRAARSEVVQRLLALIRFRNTHPAFNGDFAVLETDDDTLVLAWKAERDSCELTVDLRGGRAWIMSVEDGKAPRRIAI